MVTWLKEMIKFVSDWTLGKIGFGIAATGIVVKELAVIVIMIGVILWMFKITKVARWGTLGYLIGLVLELLGSLMV